MRRYLVRLVSAILVGLGMMAAAAAYAYTQLGGATSESSRRYDEGGFHTDPAITSALALALPVPSGSSSAAASGAASGSTATPPPPSDPAAPAGSSERR